MPSAGMQHNRPSSSQLIIEPFRNSMPRCSANQNLEDIAMRANERKVDTASLTFDQLENYGSATSRIRNLTLAQLRLVA